MRKLIAFVIGISLVSVLFFGLGHSWSQSTKTSIPEKKNMALNDYAPPPRSLDRLFPPQQKEPVYLLKMFEMGKFFSGIVADFFENDLQNAKGNFEKFRQGYVEVSKEVPEWEKEFPIEPLDELNKALEKGAKEEVMSGVEKVGESCHRCHIANMAKVQQKYHWGNFEEIKAKDPLTNEEVSFAQLTQGLNVNFNGIDLDVSQGQKEKARRQLQAFTARFQVLKNTCQNCHKTEEINAYVDQRIMSLIENVDLELTRSAQDPEVIASLIQKIGVESCFKCHLVHIPSAYAKMHWKK
jgi:cytochrome c556